MNTLNQDTHAIAQAIAALSVSHPSTKAAVVEDLVKLAPASVEPLIAAFYASLDQSLQAYIIQALAQIGDSRSLDLLAEVVGTSVANHCQGNVRRIAARGLGRIGSSSSDAEIIRSVVDKLTWALVTPEDWGLRYAAAVSMSEIATPEVQQALLAALTQEPDQVVRSRIAKALQ